MAGYCSTGQSPQRAVVLMEEEEVVKAGGEYIFQTERSCHKVLTQCGQKLESRGAQFLQMCRWHKWREIINIQDSLI
jgi:hypothetical protein